MNFKIFVFAYIPFLCRSVLAGRLRLAPGLAEFNYAPEYLANSHAFAIDPVALPLTDMVFKSGLNGGMFGAVSDALPDNWGRQVLAHNLNISPALIGNDTLIKESSNERIGALTFGLDRNEVPATPSCDHYLHLAELYDTATAIINGESVSQRALKLMRPGSSLGGARPKDVVEIGNELWLAKFSQPGDQVNIPRVEFATMRLAKETGITVPEVKLETIGRKDVFLIKRFDRQFTNGVMVKYHFISAMTALQIDDARAWRESYQNIADNLRKFCSEPQRMAHELFRRMVFNGCCNNLDDHLRNHGFLRTERGWELSPAYDIVAYPSTGLSPNSSYLNLGKWGKLVSEENLLSDVGRFGLTPAKARKIYDEVLLATKSWRKVFADCGVSATDISAFQGAFACL